MRPLLTRATILAACTLAALAAAPADAAIFTEGFSDNSAGWTLGPEWQIGSATASTGQAAGEGDPAADHTPTADNGVAGTVIGGNYGTSLHAFYFLESPAVDLSSVEGTVMLHFWRWLNIDYAPYAQAVVEVWDGSNWIQLFVTGALVTIDAAWTQYDYDVTPYKNAAFRVRFGHMVGAVGVYSMSGWNIDDVELSGGCTAPENDADGDTYPSAECGGNDCDDTNSSVHPGAAELCNFVDDDCDGQVDEGFDSQWYVDADSDTYGDPNIAPAFSCTPVAGRVPLGGDCDDANPAIHPGATELCNGVDEDCDGQIDEGAMPTYYHDFDGDGYGSITDSVQTCGSPPPGYVPLGGDCNEGNVDINPGETEICDSQDNDCDGQVDEGLTVTAYVDLDEDGYGTSFYGQFQVCPPLPQYYSLTNDDCNDSSNLVHPGATELCDGLDNDCDGQTDENCVYFTIYSIRDVPNDQGRWVRLKWTRHQSDWPGGVPTITGYSLWRLVGPGQSAALSAKRASAPAAAAPGAETAAMPPGEWDFLTSVPASGDSSYQYVAPTLCDSNSTTFCRTTFLLRANTSSPFTYFDAPQDSGYSVDNIVPPAPELISATHVAGGNQLQWLPNGAPDFAGFRIYRDVNPSFTPGPANLVFSTPNTSWLDGSPEANQSFYKITAMDVNGNQSAAASATITVGVESAWERGAGLRLVAPNPTSGGSRITFEIASDEAQVSLSLHDAAGRLIRRLAAGRFGAGPHDVTWDGRDEAGQRVAPGIYHVRYAAGGRVEVRKLAVMR